MKLRLLLLAASLAVAAPFVAHSQADKPPAAKTAPAAGDKKPNTANWWQKSALDHDRVKQVLFHANGSLSFMQATGNTSGTTLDVGGAFQARKSVITSDFATQYTRRDMIYGFGGGSAHYSERTIREQITGDLTRHASLVGGVEDYSNTMMFMNDRLSFYGGVGTAPYRSDRHQLNFIAAVGYTQFDFDRQAMLAIPSPFINRSVLALPTTSPSSGGALAMQSWRWNIGRKIAFTEDASYMQYFDTFLGHRWTINVGGDVPITKHFSFGPTYRVKEETNAIVHALTVKPNDRTFMLSFRASM